MTRGRNGQPVVAWATVAILTLLGGSGLSGTVVTPPPPPPQTAPTDLKATPAEGRVTLAWIGVSNVTGYQVFRSANGVFDSTPLTRVSGAAFTDYGITNGTTYSYRVAAYNRGGAGPFSNVATATPLAAPKELVATPGDQQVTLAWQLTAGAASYTLYRSTSSLTESFVAVATSITALSFVDPGLANGTKVYYRLRAIAADGTEGPLSIKVSATPQPPPPAIAPANFLAVPGNARVQLTWDAVPNATSYQVFRTTTGVWDTKPLVSVTLPTYRNTGLVNGTTYLYRVAARNGGGNGPFSEVATATPQAPPPAPTGFTAVAGDGEVTLSWTAAPGAAGYKLYRGTAAGREATVAIAPDITDTTYLDKPLKNGPTYYYKVTAFNVGGESPRSEEVKASPEAPQPPVDPATLAAFRTLRQATWGPKPEDVETLKTSGIDAFISGQLAAAPSEFPDTLFSQSVEATQEHFMHVALTGSDQLRQRVAWALHKIWVVSAVEVDSAPAIVTYYRLLLNDAFGNYRDLMRDITLNPAMGRYLNMLNNRSQQVTGVPPNENYPRELMQLFMLGTSLLNPNGTPALDPQGRPVAPYTEADVKELARILTGWTFGDGVATTIPRRTARENYRYPMEAVAAYHDSGEKTFLGEHFDAGQSASADLEHALDVLFRHPNLPPFISRQLIQQLVTSNPSAGYVARVAAVFADNGAGVRGDLAAVVRAVLTDAEASESTDSSGKLSEPVLFVVSQLRALNATVTDHPFMSDKAEQMGQKVLYPPSVFSYFSPGYRVRGTVGPGGAPLGGPEFQILTAVTAFERANFTGALLGGYYGDNVHVDYTPFTSRADDPAALVDYVSLLFMGGRMSPEERAEIITAVRATSSRYLLERARTAIYLTLVAAQGQVDR